MLKHLIWLSVGTFVIGAESFLVAGVLPEIAGDLNATLAACGQLVTAYALSYAIGSPVLATLFGTFPRKPLLVVALAAFALSNALAAASTSLTMLMVSRVLLGLSAGLFIPTANAVAVALVPPAMRGRAIATVIGGMTVAVAFGAPLGTLLAASTSWRTPFWVIAGVSALAALALLIGFPGKLPVTRASLAERLALAGKTPVLKALLVTFFWAMSAFVIFTYIAPFLGEVGITGAGVSAAFLAFGIASALGNAYGGIIVDRIGSVRTQTVGLTVLVAALIAVSLVANLVPLPAAGYIAVALMAVWGVAGWSFYPAQASRLVEVAPEAPVVALSLNSSALFFGQAGGAALGSLALGSVGVTELGFVAAACALIALGLLQWASRPSAADAHLRQPAE